MATPRLDFLNAKHEIFTANEAAWTREERRFHGGDGVLEELVQFQGEPDDNFTARKKQARWLNFARQHAAILAGHLASVAPLPNFGSMGEVRKRDKIDTPTLAELFFYNVDGIGNGGRQWPAWLTGVQMRACATGHRWALVEMPALPDGRAPDSPVTQADVLAGHRPYVVEFSPLRVPYWEFRDGRLDWIVLRTRTSRAGVVEGTWRAADTRLGYYLHVRRGYAGIGDEFGGGGWWLFDADGESVTDRVAHGTWDRTKGEIPIALLVADDSEGTEKLPAMSRSLTMELGQISAGLMNAISARDYDAWDAARSTRYLLGADPKSFNTVAEKHQAGAVLIPVPPVPNPDGSFSIPQIYDSSSGAVASDVFSAIIDGAIAEAHEIMVRQVTSEPGSSGESKRAGFGEATSPLLAGLAQRRESFENTLIYFAELRGGQAGSDSPKGSVTWPTEFDLTPVLQRIDRTIERMQKIGARSPTLEAELVEAAAAEDGVWPADEAKAKPARLELLSSLKTGQATAVGAAVKSLTDAGAGLGGAAKLAGLSDTDEQLLVNGSALDRTTPPPAQ